MKVWVKVKIFLLCLSGIYTSNFKVTLARFQVHFVNSTLFVQVYFSGEFKVCLGKSSVDGVPLILWVRFMYNCRK